MSKEFQVGVWGHDTVLCNSDQVSSAEKWLYLEAVYS
jgi:hypothetical protein